MLTTNLNIGLWKWIEGYLDIGALKIKERNQDTFTEQVLDLIYYQIFLNSIFQLAQVMALNCLKKAI